MNDFKIGFIGFGLIGGSIAHALKEIDYELISGNSFLYRKHCHITVFNYRNEVHPSLEKAKNDGTIDAITTDLFDFKTMNLIFLCAPVLTNNRYLDELKSIVSKDCIITDVGSVKSNIQEAAKKAGLESQFIGGHPMAGSEQTGYSHSSSRILENAYYILTPSVHTRPEIISLMKEIVEHISAIPIVLDPKRHDNITAAISHLPHLIAASLVTLVSKNDTDGLMSSLAAGGFKDITRIASSSAPMWRDICLSNKDSILTFLNQYIGQLEEIKTTLETDSGDEIFRLFTDSKEYRDKIPTRGKGPDKIYDINVDVNDEAGVIASIATLLAKYNISIKNIGIVHNREFSNGALHIEFRDEFSKEQSIGILKRYRYTIYNH